MTSAFCLSSEKSLDSDKIDAIIVKYSYQICRPRNG